MKKDKDIVVVAGFSSTCGVCGQKVHENFFACPACGAIHHEDCWRFNEGCSVYGCVESGAGRRKSSLVRGRALMVGRADDGVVVWRRSSGLFGWFSIILGVLLFSLVFLVGLPGIYGVFWGLIFMAVGLRFINRNLEILPGRVRIGGLFGFSEYETREITARRVDWMHSIIIHGDKGDQLLLLKGDDDELDRVAQMLETVAGLKVE